MKSLKANIKELRDVHGVITAASEPIVVDVYSTKPYRLRVSFPDNDIAQHRCFLYLILTHHSLLSSEQVFYYRTKASLVTYNLATQLLEKLDWMHVSRNNNGMYPGQWLVTDYFANDNPIQKVEEIIDIIKI